MKYLVIDIGTLKVYPCNNCEDIIRQVKKVETEALEETEVPLENIIFNSLLFNTPEKLAKLKQTLGHFITDNPEKNDKKIDAKTKNQFFYLYVALWSLPDVLSDDSMVNFIRQMAMWFPEWISGNEKEQRKYEQSLSHEKKKWEQKGGLLKVAEWKPFIKQSGMSVKKAMYFESLAREIYAAINMMIKGIRNENH